jgi:hypothetical protein
MIKTLNKKTISNRLQFMSDLKPVTRQLGIISAVLLVGLTFTRCTSVAQNGPKSLTHNNYNDRDFQLYNLDKSHIPLDGAEVEMIPFRKDSLFGFVDKLSGDFLIKPKYDQVFAVYRDKAIVKQGWGYGVIDKNDNIIMPFSYKNLFREGLVFHGVSEFHDENGEKAVGSHGQHTSIYNEYFSLSGEPLFGERADQQRSFLGTDNLAWYRYGLQINIRTNSGKVAKSFNVDPEREFLGICDNLLVYGSKAGTMYKYEGVDIDDKVEFSITIDTDYVKGVYKISENLFAFSQPGGDYIFYDKKGGKLDFFIEEPDVLYAEQIVAMGDAKHFVVCSKSTQKYGVIDREGKYLIEAKYHHLDNFSNGTALFSGLNANNYPQYGLINLEEDTLLYPVENGRMTVDLFETLGQPFGLYDDVYVVKAPVTKDTTINGKTWPIMYQDSNVFKYVDRSGLTVLELPASYLLAGNFSDGLAPVVNSDRKLGFINKQGELVIACEYELTAAGAYPSPSLVVPEFKNGYAYITSHKGYIDKTGKKYFSGIQLKDHYNFSH